MEHTEQALRHYDVYCKPIYGDEWPAIRIALQCPSKKCVLLNSLVSDEDKDAIKHSLQSVGAVDFLEEARKKAESGDYFDRNAFDVANRNQISDKALEMSESHLAALQDTNTVEVPLGKDPRLYDFMPVKRVLSEQRRMELEDVQQSVFEYAEDIETIEDNSLMIPKHLQAFTHARGEVEPFPQPSRTSSGKTNYQVMDAGSLLPVLALDLKPGCSVLDMCAAPGIKALTMLQTFLPDHMTLIEERPRRVEDLTRHLKFHFPREYLENINLVEGDAIRYLTNLNRDDNVKFDKVLVDVPCYNDRSAISFEDNNIFAPHRKRERLDIQPAQDELLYWGIRSCKPGGTIVYCTSTLSPPQNDGTIQRVINRLQSKDIHVAIHDTTHLAHLFQDTMNFFAGCRFGQQVVPNLTANYGPVYFSKMTRVA